MSVNIDEIDFSDPELYEYVQRSDRSTFSNNINKMGVKPKNLNVPRNVDLTDDYVTEPKPNPKNNKNDLYNTVKKLVLICLCLFLVYLFIYRYVIGYNFLKNKEYMKSAAVLSPEIMTLSSFLI
jgi:hypothetical protein